MKSPRTLSMAAVAVPLFVLTACGSDGGGSSSDGGGGGGGEAAACEPAGEDVELSLVTWVPGMEDVVELWNADNPDIQVTVENTPAGNAGTYNNLFNGLEAGTAPDLSQIEYDSLSSFRLQDGLTDISACAGVEDASGEFVDWTWSQVQLGGEGVWAVPQDIGPMAMYYRSDLFQQAGITEPPTTWEGYYEAAKQLKAATGAYITHFPQGDANWFTGLLWQRGANLFEIDGDQVVVDVDSPEAQEVADYWQRMIDEDLVATDLQGFSPDLYAAWGNGTVASWVSAAWGYSTIRDNAASTAGLWSVASMPQWSEGETAAGNWGGSTTAVLSSTEYPAEAAEFALWLNTDPEALAMANELGGLYPAAENRSDIEALQGGVEFYGGQEVFEVFGEAAGQVDNEFTWGPTMTDTYTAMSDGFTSALNGQGTLSEALSAAQTASVESLEAQGVTVAD